MKNAINLHHIYEKYVMIKIYKDTFIKISTEIIKETQMVIDALKNIY
jgi:hypothetical protein